MVEPRWSLLKVVLVVVVVLGGKCEIGETIRKGESEERESALGLASRRIPLLVPLDRDLHEPYARPDGLESCVSWQMPKRRQQKVRRWPMANN